MSGYCVALKKVSTWRINGTEQAVGRYSRKNGFFQTLSGKKKGGGAFKENLNIFSERYRKKSPPVEVGKAKKWRNATWERPFFLSRSSHCKKILSRSFPAKIKQSKKNLSVQCQKSFGFPTVSSFPSPQLSFSPRIFRNVLNFLLGFTGIPRECLMVGGKE